MAWKHTRPRSSPTGRAAGRPASVSSRSPRRASARRSRGPSSFWFSLIRVRAAASQENLYSRQYGCGGVWSEDAGQERGGAGRLEELRLAEVVQPDQSGTPGAVLPDAGKPLCQVLLNEGGEPAANLDCRFRHRSKVGVQVPAPGRRDWLGRSLLEVGHSGCWRCPVRPAAQKVAGWCLRS